MLTRVANQSGCGSSALTSHLWGSISRRTRRRGWRECYAPGMLSDGRIVRSEIDAVDLVAGYVAMEPLDRGAHCLENVDDFWGELGAIGPRIDFRLRTRVR